MDLDGGRSVSVPKKQNDYQNLGGTTWVPVRPIVQRPEPIYADRLLGSNQQFDSRDWGRMEGCHTYRFSSQENRAVSASDSTNCYEVNRVCNWGEDFTGRVVDSGSNGNGNGNGNGQHAACVNLLHGWDNVPFVDLLTQQSKGGSSTPLENVMAAPSSPFDFGYSPQNGCSWQESVYASSSPLPQDLSSGSKPWNDFTFTPQMTQCELSTTGRQVYDLNMLPGMISDDLPPSSSVLQFTPIINLRNQNNVDIATSRVEIIELDKEQTLSEAVDSSLPTLSTAIAENSIPEKSANQVIDLNATPQQKQKRRKHRPKVIREVKKKVQVPTAVNNSDGPKENSTVRRKHVRKKRGEDPSTETPLPKVPVECSDPKQVETAKKSARRVLDFDLGENPELQATVPNCQVTANDKLGTSEQKIVNPYTHPEWISPNGLNSSATEITADRQAATKKRQCDDILIMDNTRAVNQTGAQHLGSNLYTAFHAEDLGRKSSGMCLPDNYKKRRTEEQCSIKSSTSSSTNAQNTVNFVRQTRLSCSNASILELQGDYSVSAPQLQTDRVPTTQAEAVDRMQAFDCMFSLSDKERFTKKRSNVPTRVRDLASLMGILESKLMPAFPGKETLSSNEVQGAAASPGPQNCMEALVAESSAKVARRKRSQKLNSLGNLASFNTNVTNKEIWKQMFSVDTIIQRFKHLNINTGANMVSYQGYNALVPYKKENHQSQNALVPYKKKNHQNDAVTNQVHKQERNALVVYGKDGTIIPFDGTFYPVKKRRPRPKVDLDDETSKVWRLLLENINNEGIDGSDEQKAKWWEEERRVFRGRADSFIARMHLVQGDRRFSKWKGSVVDSVVGVFLTQNVSDHLSSSAFMSMAAHFPLKSKSKGEQLFEDGTGIVVEEPDLCILDHEDIIKWKGKMSLNLDCDQSSTAPNDPGKEERELVNGQDSVGSGTDGGTSCVIGDRTIMEDVISSQSSVDSSIAQTSEIRHRQYSQSNLESKDPTTLPASTSLISSTTFVELLHIAAAPTSNHNREISPGEADKTQEYTHNQTGTCDKQSQLLNGFDGPESSLVESITHSYSIQTPSLRSQEVDPLDSLEEESRSSEVSYKKDENRMSNINRFTEESSSKSIHQEKLSVSFPEMVISQEFFQSNISSTIITNGAEQTRAKPYGDNKQVELLIQGKTDDFQQNTSPNFSGEISDVTESTSRLNFKKNSEHNGVEPYLNEQNHSCVTGLNDTAADTTTLKRKRVVKEKAPPIDWDNLRKQAQANGPRDKNPNTMDSVDWEAVRCADVGEIAHTIRERGMNNMLAERIQAFLNRLLSDHGSLDLEWLRDVPPDKAKEYLLSIRGLGLKSVECIRLLTLHHLAFPVDTNVGRIAVRLGWVPLQPLPESLQLHLLELYPVLESIQKYLWPRLCKLDQRTLYELHYQMITFGKVFCTKSKPNCNACPMRGECRHFASAFASARLALPGPEEKGIVMATENQTAGENPTIIPNTPQLPQPQLEHHSVGSSQIEGNHPTVAKSGMSNNEPIIEEPQTPEPENDQILECDIEDECLGEDPDEIPTIKLNIEEFSQNLQDYMQNNMVLQEGDVSRALVALTPELASLPAPKLKYISRLRTEHQVYELPDSHPLLQGMDRREPDDPSSYLLAIWTPGETVDSIQPPERNCSSSQENGELCAETTCFSCNSIREANTQTVRGTLLIPCRTAMRGSFPLNGTYFQVNEVFADHDSSLNPIDVPRAYLWNLPRRTVYFGTSIPSIFKGLTTEGIQYCFWRGFVCVRGFDQNSRSPRPLIARLHFPASRLVRTAKGKPNDE